MPKMPVKTVNPITLKRGVPNNVAKPKAMEVIYPWPPVAVPPYNVGRYGRWEVRKTPPHVTTAYYLPQDKNPPGYALYRMERGRFGNKPWMSFTQMELQSHMPHVAVAYGHTVVAGLGMGMYLFNICQKKNVEKITVIERDQDVIDLFMAVAKPQDWVGWEKVRFVVHDALSINTSPDLEAIIGADYLYVDIWERLFEARALDDMKSIYLALKPDCCSYWGMEGDFGEWCVKNFIKMDREGADAAWTQWVKATGIRLIGVEWEHMGSLAMAAYLVSVGALFRRVQPTEAGKVNALCLHMLGVMKYAPPVFKDKPDA